MPLDDLALAVDLVRQASDIALAFSARGVRSELKADGSPVTEADLAIESTVLATLAKERPDDAILSEERGQVGQGQRRWLVDPLDGTSLFLDGVGGWGTLITLQEDDESVLAVITRPLDSRYWWAVRGIGAFGNDLSSSPTREHPLTLSTARSLADARVTAWGDYSSTEMAMLSELPGWIAPGVDSFERLVGGELDVVVSLGGYVWDHAPCVLILEEAGGVFRDPRGGKRLDLVGGVYSNTWLSDPVGHILGWY